MRRIWLVLAAVLLCVEIGYGAEIEIPAEVTDAVPVVGSILSDATGTVLAGAGMLKSAVGVFGLLAVLAICLTPFVTMAVQYLLYKLAAFLAGTVTEEPLAELIDALGSAFGLMLGMTGSCALALLISIISSVSVVSG